MAKKDRIPGNLATLGDAFSERPVEGWATASEERNRIPGNDAALGDAVQKGPAGGTAQSFGTARFCHLPSPPSTGHVGNAGKGVTIFGGRFLILHRFLS
jgi:hypothetical protein